jgi:hypothetical protein
MKKYKITDSYTSYVGCYELTIGIFETESIEKAIEMASIINSQVVTDKKILKLKEGIWCMTGNTCPHWIYISEIK